MKYVSIDIETTGLNPDEHQVLQIGAVIDCDRGRPVEELPSFMTAIHHRFYQGDPFALGMNGALLTKIAKGEIRTMKPEEAWNCFAKWLKDNGYTLSRDVVAAGKNFGSFDRQFLRRLWPNFNGACHYRSLDPAMFYLCDTDLVPPSAEECAKRAGLTHTVTHDALDDARLVVRLIRHGRRS